jgi:hypothetical protein
MSSFALLDKEHEEDLRQGKHLVLSVQASNARTEALVDNGSEADPVDTFFARKVQTTTANIQTNTTYPPTAWRWDPLRTTHISSPGRPTNRRSPRTEAFLHRQLSQIQNNTMRWMVEEA